MLILAVIVVRSEDLGSACFTLHPYYSTMKPLQTLVLILALSETLLARPIPSQPNTEYRPSFPWKRYLPTIGAIGVIGSLFALVLLGTKHNEAYNTIESVDRLKHDPKVAALPPEDREYLFSRIQHIGREKDLPEEQREEMEGNDYLHGFPASIEMPGTTGMGKSAIKKISSVYRKLAKAEEKLGQAKIDVDLARKEETNRRWEAGEMIATEWRNAVDEALASTEGSSPLEE